MRQGAGMKMQAQEAATSVAKLAASFLAVENAFWRDTGASSRARFERERESNETHP